LLKEDKFLTIISVAGTALAICMIMVIVIIFQVKNANCAPETHRDRTMWVKWASVFQKDNPNYQSNSRPSLKTIKAVFYNLKTPEAVSGVLPGSQKLAGIPGGISNFKSDVLYTDASFWKIFDFKFVAGYPYTPQEFESGIKKVVITESTARKLYGKVEVVGKPILLSYEEYSIGGVVKDVSSLAEASYAQIWVPYTTVKEKDIDWEDGLLGNFRCFILARSKDDFNKIQAEVDNNVAVLNASLKSRILSLRGQPDTQFEQSNRKWANEDCKAQDAITQYIIIFIILLLVPAINLSGMTLSRMRKRMAEIGVRKAFGATQKELMQQIMYENFILTLMGGVVGLALSYIAVVLLKSWLVMPQISLDSAGQSFLHSDMLFQPAVFLYALVFCLLLNTLSAGIPAWRASKANIVNALNDK
jgi:putative ABC transport system permease protein